MDKNFEEVVLTALNDLRAELREQGQQLREQGQQLRKLEAQTGQIERDMAAIRTLPVPYGRPKTFVSATEMHSVSNPVTAKQGYQG